jgi:hypothetical protein
MPLSPLTATGERLHALRKPSHSSGPSLVPSPLTSGGASDRPPAQAASPVGARSCGPGGRERAVRDRHGLFWTRRTKRSVHPLARVTFVAVRLNQHAAAALG